LLSSQISRSDPLTTALIRKERNGEPGASVSKVIGEGEGWRVLDIVCTAGPHDRPFEERHAWTSISLVMSGTFSHRSDRGSSLMSAGALMLGSFGRGFECSHQHGDGDRCLSFQFAQELFERIARDAGATSAALHHDRLPPLRALAPITARIATALIRRGRLEEIGLELAGTVVELDRDTHREIATPAARDRARIADVLHHLEAHVDDPHTLAKLANIGGLSRYHFLRTFKRVTGITPHQWMLRARLRKAARRLVASRDAITDVALDVGFNDLSNFIRSFRAEFGISPRQYRVSMS
jgi:AraC family transcriptional regulator